MTNKSVQYSPPMHDPQEVNSTLAYRTLIQIWILRILLDLDCYRRVGVRFNIDADDLTTFLELDLAPGEEPSDGFVPVRLAAHLRNLESSNYEVRGTVSGNIKCLSRALLLSPVEEKILEFILLLHRGEELGEVTDLLGSDLTIGDIVESLSVILDIPNAEINKAISSDAILFTSGLVWIYSGTNTLRTKLKVLSRLIDAVSVPQVQPLGILEQFLEHAPDPKLVPDDFEDYRIEYELLSHYLKRSLEMRTPGCNILIHGLPGVGKTQLVHTLCHDLRVNLYEVSTQSANHEPLSSLERLSVFQLSQKMLARHENTALIFDEMEDVFPDAEPSWLTEKQGSNAHKSWFNQQLETNQLPVFWLANDVSQLNPAYIRRFDIVLELRPMRAKAKSRLIEQACVRAGVRPGAWISKAAENKYLSPALIEKVTGVMGKTHLEYGDSDLEVFEKLANGTLNAMGFPLLNLADHRPVLTYKLNYLNVDADIEKLIKGLETNREGRLLCFGPPGTGKTEFALHLARKLDTPLLQFRASDILGPYVGMTEQKLARAFSQAKEEGAIMLLDEIDSLLRSRDNATHSWEVTQVNELLIQMENFRGVLIACTNHKRSLDNAAARRFDLKIGFDYMTPEHAWELFEEVIKTHKAKIGRGKHSVKAKVMGLRHLTPGDYMTAVRRLSLCASGVSAFGLYEALEQEIKAKGLHHRRGIGFAAVI